MEAGGDDRNESVSTAFDFSACTTAETVSLIHATGLAVQQISVIISSQKKKKKSLLDKKKKNTQHKAFRFFLLLKGYNLSITRYQKVIKKHYFIKKKTFSLF